MASPLTPFLSVFLEAYFRASFLGLKFRRISLSNAFLPSFCAHIYIYNNVYLKFFRFSFKKVAWMFCHIVESAYLCTRKRETTAFAIEFFERFHIRH